jgi:hypothetical protein
MSTTITGMTDGSEWDDGELGDDDEDDEELDEWEGGVGGTGSASVGNGTKLNGRKKKDEPMSPVAVVRECNVMPLPCCLFLELVWTAV